MKILALVVVLLAGSASFAVGQEASDVVVIQKALRILGYEVGPIDGTMNRATKAAVIRYQIDCGLRPTGEMSSQTWAHFIPDVAKALKSASGDELDNVLPRTTSESQGYGSPSLVGDGGEYLGSLSANKYDPNSTGNPYGAYGSPYSPNGINNPYSTYGSPYSVNGATNPYTSGGPKIYAKDGTYLGRLNANRYDPESISNPYGLYGSRYSPMSIKNPYGVYGSPYSPLSPSNPYLSGSDDK